MNDQLWWDDIQPGDRFATGHHVVMRDDVIDFATRYDPQPYHIDDAAAAANPIFGRLSACGLHSFAMATRLIYDAFVANGIKPVAGGGIDALRFERPVYPGDTLSGSVVVEGVRPLKSRTDRGLVQMRMHIRNQQGETVLHYSSALFLPRRDGAA